MTPASNTALRLNRTICMHICQAQYCLLIQHAIEFRIILDVAIKEYPNIFPPEIAFGYKMKDARVSKKLNLKIRRIVIAGISYTIKTVFCDALYDWICKRC